MTTQDRRTYNLEILNKLYKIVDSYPDLRFGQIVEVFCKGQQDFFNEEPDKTLQRVNEKIQSYGNQGTR